MKAKTITALVALATIALLAGCEVDIENPTVAITYPDDGAYVSGIVTITATADDNVGVERVEFYIDDTLKHIDTDAPYSYSWNTMGLSVGSSHSIKARAYDKEENMGESQTIYVTIAQISLTLVGQLAIPNFYPGCIAIYGSYAYLTGGASGGDCLRAIDISNPASPTEVWAGLPNIGRNFPMLIKDNYLYVLYSNKGRIFDISNPSYPESVGVFNNGDTLMLVGQGDIYDNYLFTGTFTPWSKYYFVVWDITNPTSPSPVGSYSTGPGNEFIYDVKISSDGNYAYLAVGGYGLRIIDVSNPLNPVEVGSLNTGDGAAMALYGSYVFLADNVNNRIHIIDVSNPASPFEVNTLGGQTHGLYLSYPYFYQGHAYHLYVFDISNFSSSIPPPIIDYTGGMHVSGIVVLGNYIYVAWGEDGLVILKME